MKQIYPILLTGLLLLNFSGLQATHIVGSEMFYECINPATFQYRITLKMYRDCIAGQAPYDDVITLFVFSARTGARLQFVQVPRPPLTPEIQPENWDACVAVPPEICVQEGTYVTTLTLPPIQGGYDLGWTRCCRNAAITNLLRPLQEGITFSAHIPDPNRAACNTMPTFNQVPPIFLCKDEPFNFDHSASDAEGDSLSYEITNPFTGTNFQGLGTGNPNQGGNQPVADPFDNPMGPPPYRNVRFNAGYSFNDPFGSGNFNIDPQTGFISVTPDRTGIFVFAISVFEWRDGQLLSENRRDFQIHILQCRPQGDPPKITHDLSNVPSDGDTVFVNALQDFCFDVEVTDPNMMDALTAYTVSAAFGNGTFFPPAADFEFTGVNPLQGQVCWRPSCLYKDQLVPLVIGARDIMDCPNISDVFDTVWVKINVPPNEPPEISADFGDIVRDQDTLIVSAEKPFCYDLTVTDPDNNALQFFPLSEIFDEGGGPDIAFSGVSPVNAQVCWEPGCELENQVIELKVGARDIGTCSSNPPVEQSIYVKVIVPPNDPPLIQTDLTGNTLVNDTIQVVAEADFCFSFNASDINITDTLSLFTMLGEELEMNSDIEITSSGINPLQGQLCWTPGCEYQDQLIPLILGVKDQGVCDSIKEALDTVYVRVIVPENQAPEVQRDLSNTIFRNDTVFVEAQTQACYSVQISEADLGDSLTARPLLDAFSTMNLPEINFSGTNPIEVDICWTPNCDEATRTFPLVIEAADQGFCQRPDTVLDTVFITVQIPPNQAPVTSHDLSGLNTFGAGDTILITPESELCYTLNLSDPDLGDSLEFELLGPVFSDPSTAISFNTSGVNPVLGQVCWTPDCNFNGQTVPLIVKARDNAGCQNELEAFDTVYVKIEALPAIAPEVGKDLSGNDFNGDTIFIDINDGLCYDFYVADQSPENGVEYVYEFQTFAGSNIALGQADIITRNDSILGSVCFQSDCSNGGSLYRVVITGRDESLCPPYAESRDTVYIKVNTQFTVDLGPDLSFCAGSGGTELSIEGLPDNGTFFYSWGCTLGENCGFSDPNAANPTVNPGESATYFVQVTDKDGCTSEIDSIYIEINQLPIVNAGPDQGFCVGESGVQLEAVIENDSLLEGPFSFQWLPATGLDDPNSANPFANPSQSTQYTVIATASNGCSSLSTTLDGKSTVDVGVSEPPVATTGGDLNVCEGDSVQLLGFATGGNPNYTFSWFPEENLNDPSSPTPWASPASDQTYYLRAFADGCPGSIDSIRVSVRPKPEVNPGNQHEVCALTDLALDGTATQRQDESYTYTWTDGVGNTISTDPGYIFNLTNNTDYSLVATSNFGCQNEPYPVQIEVLPTPIVSAPADTFTCDGQAVELIATHSFLGGDGQNLPDSASYSWGPIESLSNPDVRNPIADPRETTLYTVSATYGNCSSADQVKLDIFEQLDVEAFSDKSNICAGDTVQLSAVGVRSNAVISWGDGAEIFSPSSLETGVTPSESKFYSVMVSDAGCTAVDSVWIEVNPSPIIPAQLSALNGCTTLALTASADTVSLQGQTIFYQWNFGDGSEFGSGPVTNHEYTEAGSYEVWMTAVNSFGCSYRELAGTVQVNAKGLAFFESEPPVSTDLVLPNATVNFTNTSENAVSYLWDFGDGNSSTEMQPEHTYIETGSYTVTLTVTDVSGCTDIMILGPFIVKEPELFIPNVFSPNDDGINDVFKVDYTGNESFNLVVVDRWGVTVFESENDPQRAWAGNYDNGSSAQEGVYYYRLKIGTKVYQGNVSLLR